MLINEIESEILKAKKSAFSSNMVSIDRNLVLDLVGRLRSALPSVIREATAIKRDRESIMREAEDYAQSKIESANAEAERLVSETEILTQAKADAESMLKEADENYRKMDYDTRYCAYKILDESEKILRDSIAQITENKRKLAKE